jgi:hypothetical protein
VGYPLDGLSVGMDLTPIFFSTYALKSAHTLASAALLDHMDQVAAPSDVDEQAPGRPPAAVPRASFSTSRRARW